jgi:hypothetical protein
VTLVAEAGLAVVRLAIIGIARHGVRVAVERRNAAIEQRVEARDLADIGDAQLLAGPPGERRHHHLPIQPDEVAPAVRRFRRDDDPRGQRPRHGTGRIQLYPARSERSQREHRISGRDEIRRLADDIDAARRIDVAEQRARRPLQQLDPFGGGRISGRPHAAVGEEAIDVIFPTAIRCAQEAADGEIVHDAATIVLVADAADQFERVRQAIGPGGSQQVTLDRSARLRERAGGDIR